MDINDIQHLNQNFPQHEPKTQLFVSDFGDSVTEENLIAFFSEFQDKIVRIIINKNNKKALDLYQQKANNATIYFRDTKSANLAITQLNLKKLYGKTVRVMWHDNDHSNRYNAQGNLFIKNVPENVSPREFYEFFLKFGDIVSTKLNEDDDGKHYGYGYVHFAEAESANKAMEMTDGKEVWPGGALEVRNFMKKNERGFEANRNIYVKNFPNEFLEGDINKLFNVYGPISFSKVLTDVNTKKKFAIVSFENEDSVNNAILKANGKVYGEHELYVVSLMKKNDRQRFLSNSIAENNFRLSNNFKYCNLHVRNVPFSVKEDELCNNFLIFGEIKSVKIAKMLLVTKEKNETKEIETSKGFGYVCFMNPESAKSAMDKLNNSYLAKHEDWKRPLLIEYFMPKKERLQVLRQNQQIGSTNANLNQNYQQQPNPNMNQFMPNQGFPQMYQQQYNPQQGYQQNSMYQPQMYPQQNNMYQQQMYPQQMQQNQPKMAQQGQQNQRGQKQQQFNQQQEQNPNFNQMNQILQQQQFVNPNSQNQNQNQQNQNQNQQNQNQNQNQQNQLFQNQQNQNQNQQNQNQNQNQQNQNQQNQNQNKNQNLFNQQQQSEDDPDFNYLNSLDDDFQKKDYLGEFIFKKIEKHPLAEKKTFTIDTIGKITGMILGIEDIKEITEICKDPELLRNRIVEAIELMESNN